MGRFSANVNVKCADFARALTELMTKRGFEVCGEEDASRSYLIAQGGEWATVARDDYNSALQSAGEDAELLFKELNTPAFMTEIVDSDWAILKLNGDEVIVGDGSGYGIEDAPKGDKNVWEPLLANGTFEELTAIWEKNEVFVEDILGNSAPLFGIEPRYIAADFRDLSDMTDDENVTALCFKKIGETKPMTLNAGFIKVFGEALEPLGFKRIKGRYPYFVRVVPGEEIIHVITCEESLCSYPNARKFDIVGGIATGYRYRIDLDSSSKHNTAWLNSIGAFYARTVAKSEYNQKTFESLDGVRYDENDNLSLLNAMNKSLEFANKYMLPYLNRAVDLKSSLSCIKVLRQKCSTNNFSYPLNFEGCGHHDEGFLYIKTDDETLRNTLKSKIDGIIVCDEQARQRAAEKYTFFTDPEVLAEIERRKANNTEILRSCGLNI